MFITRRRFLKLIGGGIAGSAAMGAYAFAIEPLYRLSIKNYQITPKNWPLGNRIRIALLADLHACKPWMAEARIAEIVTQTNALKPDLTLLLGDYVSGMRMKSGEVPARIWASLLGELEAELGVYGILGNHDWWEDERAQRERTGPTIAQIALENVGIPILENKALRLKKDETAFWLAGIGDQLAFSPTSHGEVWTGTDDLEGTLGQVTDDNPVLLMAHEPDIFTRVPDRVSVTVSGHTHGGQVRLFGYSPVVPSRFGNRYAYGHIEENERHLVVSGGLGCSILPVRFGSAPEIVVLELGEKLVS